MALVTPVAWAQLSVQQLDTAPPCRKLLLVVPEDCGFFGGQGLGKSGLCALKLQLKMSFGARSSQEHQSPQPVLCQATMMGHPVPGTDLMLQTLLGPGNVLSFISLSVQLSSAGTEEKK